MILIYPHLLTMQDIQRDKAKEPVEVNLEERLQAALDPKVPKAGREVDVGKVGEGEIVVAVRRLSRLVVL